MQLAQRRASSSLWFHKLQVEAVASLFLILGSGLFASLIFSIATHPALRIGELEFVRVIWRFLQHFGVLRPLLLIAAGYCSFVLGCGCAPVTSARHAGHKTCWSGCCCW